MKRGRIEVQVAVQTEQGNHHSVTFNEPLLQRYHDALVDLTRRFGLKDPVTLDQLLSLPQAMTVTEERMPADQVWAPMIRAAQTAVLEVVRSRQREGAKLVTDLRAQLRAIDRHARAIKRRLPSALGQQRQRLRERLQDILGRATPASSAQLEQVAALIKEADIHEELVRLESHLTYMTQTLHEGQLVGKRLDFIAQELMRETNTMGAKVNDSEAAQHVVEIKGCVEKIREQVQNLE